MSHLPPSVRATLDEWLRRLYQQDREIAAQEVARVTNNVIAGGKILPTALPIASASSLGAIKVGSGLAIAADGTLSQSSAGSGAVTRISQVSVGAGGASAIDFTSIAGSYTHLELRGSLILATSGTTVSLQINSDSGSNYQYVKWYGFNNNTSLSELHTGQSSIHVAENLPVSGGHGRLGLIVRIYDYADTNNQKDLNAQVWSVDYDGSGSFQANFGGIWLNTAAITGLHFFGNVNFAQYSELTLYGIT